MNWSYNLLKVCWACGMAGTLLKDTFLLPWFVGLGVGCMFTSLCVYAWQCDSITPYLPPNKDTEDQEL